MTARKAILLAAALIAFIPGIVGAQAAAKKPNILVIWGDDIGWYNPSIYHRGDMGYQTPNIDRIGKEGAIERGTESAAYDWTYFAPRGFVIVPAQAIVAKWLDSFKEFPIRQKPASFNLDDVMQKLTPPQP
jgi:hypothetical protein